MSSEEALIRALLDESGMRWPSARSTLSDHRRQTMGAVYPRAFVAAGGGHDRWRVSTELLVRGARPRLSVEPRFLHLVDRSLLRAVGDNGFEPTDALEVAGERILACEEARERAVLAGGLRLDATGEVRMPIEVSAGSDREEVAGGAIVRRWGALAAELEVRWRRLHDGLLRVGVTVSNGYAGRVADRTEASRHALLAAHVLLSVEGGAFVSSLEPPEDLELAVLGCRNDGLFPVLLGKAAARDRVLASPVILYQPDRLGLGRREEGPGEAEIDAMLAPGGLRRSAEPEAMRSAADWSASGPGGVGEASDTGAEEPLATPSPTAEAMLRLHGAIRDWQVLRLVGTLDESTAETPALSAGSTRPGGQ